MLNNRKTRQLENKIRSLEINLERMTRKYAKAQATIDRITAFAHQHNRTEKRASDKLQHRDIDKYTTEG